MTGRDLARSVKIDDYSAVVNLTVSGSAYQLRHIGSASQIGVTDSAIGVPLCAIPEPLEYHQHKCIVRRI